MNSYIKETDSGIYRITKDGEVFSQSKIKIPLNGKGRTHTGEI